MTTRRALWGMATRLRENAAQASSQSLVARPLYSTTALSLSAAASPNLLVAGPNNCFLPTWISHKSNANYMNCAGSLSPLQGGGGGGGRILTGYSYQHQQTRSFARPRRNDNTNTTLTNEHLVKAIMMKFPNETKADDVQVRMVVDNQGQSTSSVVSLREAIQTAVENDKDLIEVAIQQDVPVVKVMALSSLVYQTKKQKQAATALPVKEIQLKAGIAENDLLRKVTQLIGYLEKGHKVKIRIRGTRKALTVNRNAVADTLEAILKMVQEQEAGETVNDPDFNEQRTQVQVLLQAPSKKK